MSVHGITLQHEGEKLVIFRSGGNYANPTLRPNTRRGAGVFYQVVETAILDTFLHITRKELYPNNQNKELDALKDLQAKLDDKEAKLEAMTEA